jgi:hypothetical protein
MECGLAGETEVLGENLPQRHFCPSQNPTWPDPGLNPGRRDGKPATNRLSYGASLIMPLLSYCPHQKEEGAKSGNILTELCSFSPKIKRLPRLLRSPFLSAILIFSITSLPLQSSKVWYIMQIHDRKVRHL